MERGAEECKARGNAAFKDGRYGEAVAHFSDAIAADGSNAVLFSNRSGALASLGRYADSLEDAERAVALRPDWAKGYSRKAAALYGLGRYADAVATYDAGLHVEPANPQMVQALADVRARYAAARALFEAVAEDDVARVSAALAAGVHPDGYAAEDGTTALMIACRRGSAECASRLIGSGARAGARNRAGESAGSLARKGGHEAALRCLPADERGGGLSGLFSAAKGLASSASCPSHPAAQPISAAAARTFRHVAAVPCTAGAEGGGQREGQRYARRRRALGEF